MSNKEIVRPKIGMELWLYTFIKGKAKRMKFTDRNKVMTIAKLVRGLLYLYADGVIRDGQIIAAINKHEGVK